MVRSFLFLSLFLCVDLYSGCLNRLAKPLIADAIRDEVLKNSWFKDDYYLLLALAKKFTQKEYVAALVDQLNNPEGAEILDCDSFLNEFIKNFQRPHSLNWKTQAEMRGWVVRNLDTRQLFNESEKRDWIQKHVMYVLSNTSVRKHVIYFNRVLQGHFHNPKDSFHLADDIPNTLTSELSGMREELSEKINIPVEKVDAYTILKYRGRLSFTRGFQTLARTVVLRMIERNIHVATTPEHFQHAFKEFFWQKIHFWIDELERKQADRLIVEADSHRTVSQTRVDNAHTPENNPQTQQRAKPRPNETEVLRFILQSGYLGR